MGTLKAYYRAWDWASEPFTMEHKPIASRDCTLEELGLDKPEAEDDSSTRRLADEEESEEAKDS